MHKSLMPLNLQRFSDDDAPVIVDVDIDTPDDDEDIDENIPDNGDPLPANPAPAPAVPMPSGVSNEAWRNVEELLVTLSNNTRVNIGELREDIRKMVESGRTTNEQLLQLLERTIRNQEGVERALERFNQLLENATVETDDSNPEDTPANPEETQDKPRKRAGYLSRRGR